MSLLELLEKDYREKQRSANLYLKESQEKLRRLIISTINIKGVEVSARCVNLCEYPIKEDSFSSYHSVRIDLINKDKMTDDRDDLSFDLYIHKGYISINNCCCGNWKKNSLYHKMLIACTQLIEAEDKLLEFDPEFDRELFKQEREAQRAFDKEESAVKYAEECKVKEELSKALVPGAIYGEGIKHAAYRVLKVSENTVSVQYLEARSHYNYDTNEYTYTHYVGRNRRMDKKDIIDDLYRETYVFLTEAELALEN